MDKPRVYKHPEYGYLWHYYAADNQADWLARLCVQLDALNEARR